MQNIVGMLVSSFGIPPQLASTAMTGVTRMFLQKSTPQDSLRSFKYATQRSY
jgi:hypothetical protein